MARQVELPNQHKIVQLSKPSITEGFLVWQDVQIRLASDYRTPPPVLAKSPDLTRDGVPLVCDRFGNAVLRCFLRQ